jgi:flagellin-like protein
MKKKGISPLIATVLIIGFTVALAAVIMTWGTGFTKRMQESTEETSDVQITCATDVVFDVKSACEDTGKGAGYYKLTIANNGNIDIAKFQVRLYESADAVTTKEYDFSTTGGTGISKFGIESQSVDSGLGAAPVKKIEAIPVISTNGKTITCAQNIDSFGDITGPGIADC